MKKIKLILSFLIIFSGSSIFAQGWNVIDFPIDENINGVSFVNEDTAFFITNQGKLLRTFDRLKTFDTFTPAPEISLEDVYFLNSEVGYICGAKGTFMKTTDGGYTFQNYALVDTIPWFFDIEMINNNIGFVIGMTREKEKPFGGLMFQTTDGGKKWNRLEPLGLGLSEVQYVNNKVMVQSFGRMSFSDDYGKTWESDSTIAGSPGRAFSFYENNGILCGISGMCAYSEDGGKSWYPAEQNKETMYITAQMINNSEGYIGGTNSSLLKTNNGGKSWSPELMAKSFNILDLELINDRIYAVGSNGGIIWKKVK